MAVELQARSQPAKRVPAGVGRRAPRRPASGGGEMEEGTMRFEGRRRREGAKRRHSGRYYVGKKQPCWFVLPAMLRAAGDA